MENRVDSEYFTPKEIMGAIGITRTAFSNRARMLGIKQTGEYTFEQAYMIANYIPSRRQSSQKHSDELKKRILDRMSDEGYIATFVKQKNGSTVLVRAKRR